MTWSLIIVLILIGLIFILLEILVIPGTGLVGVAGMAVVIFAIWSAYHNYGTTDGHIILGSTLAVTAISIYFAVKAKTWQKIMLKDNIDSKANTIESTAISKGDIGKTVSRLNPMGKAIINDEFYEVSSHGELIEPDKDIEVIKIEGNKIFVKLKSN